MVLFKFMFDIAAFRVFDYGFDGLNAFGKVMMIPIFFIVNVVIGMTIFPFAVLLILWELFVWLWILVFKKKDRRLSFNEVCKRFERFE